MANQYLALALFIMLLSFFIILNGISDYEDERSQPIMASISAVFSSSAISETASAPSTMESTSQSDKKGSALDELEELFTAQITGLKAQQNAIGTSMSLTMKLDDFEKALTSPETASVNFMPTLISLVQTQNNIPYRMDIIVGIGKNPARLNSEDPRAAAAMVRKAAFLAQTLENAGLPNKLVSTGLGAGPAGYVNLHFRHYEPFDLASVSSERETE